MVGRRRGQLAVQLVLLLGLAHAPAGQGAEASLDQALLARQHGHLRQAEQILSQLLMSSPQNPRLKLELARVLYEQQRYQQAQTIVAEVLHVELPAPVKKNVEDFRDKIEQRVRTQRRWLYASAFTVGHSGRISALGTGSGAQGLVGTNESVDEDSPERSIFLELQTQIEHRPQHDGWLFNGVARYRQYQQFEAHDIGWLDLRLGHRFAMPKQQYVDANTIYQQFNSEGKLFTAHGAGLAWSWYGKRPLVAQLEWISRQYHQLKVPDPRDGDRVALELSQLGYFGDSRLRYHWALRYADYSARINAQSYALNELALGLRYPIKQHWQLSLSGIYTDIDEDRLPVLDFPFSSSEGDISGKSSRWQAHISLRRNFGLNWHAEIGFGEFDYSEQLLPDDQGHNESYFTIVYRH